MAVCMVCKQEMTKAVGCTDTTLEFKPKPVYYPRIKYGEETRFEVGAVPDPCHDCGTPVGQQHHPGCDMEECPRCHGQLISCSCNNDGSFSDPVVA